ncbi:hypothetical protein Scep_008230 [Stephania cephalantha]|uniref:Fanconi Anaemia group E protein C-terminal domain-containing protein n=1 Tax=Stephania cephalantha TaxID=152367 RepID=A0AAP0KBA6_9MAGN
MEVWVPLFNIFLNSPCPESEASLWMQNSFNDASKTTTNTNTNSLLLLLSNPTDVAAVQIQSPSSSPSQSKRVMWIQTLPNAAQSRILSFLNVERRRFCGRELRALASNILRGSGEGDFWVKKAARQLLDEMPSSTSDGVLALNLDGKMEEEFGKLPGWLESATGSTGSVFPWLPISRDELRQGALSSGFLDDDDDEEEKVLLVDDEELSQAADETEAEIICLESVHIAPEIQSAAAGLKAQILTFESTSRTAELADQILQLCSKEVGVENPLLILELIEPWRADDETASILLSHLGHGGQDIAWPSHVLCSVFLPKLLVLGEPASRVLITAIIGFCKLHQKAAVDAVLLPLVFRRDGINTPTCDLVTRVIKECLHSAHVSSYCQRLLCGGHEARGIVCLPCHQCLLSNELVWTEPLFTLFQNILSFNVRFTQDSVDHLVSAIQQSVGRFSKSLKFCNFLLCFVSKSDQPLRHHKFLLTELAEQTDTFVTKSILSKLGRR